MFWGLLVLPNGKAPAYAGEVIAAKQVSFLNYWTWTDYVGYDRYSPFGALLVSFLDVRVVRPLLQLRSIDDIGTVAIYLIPLFLIIFCLIAWLMYKSLRYLGADCVSSFFGAVFVGTHKGFAHYLGFVTSLAGALLLVAALLATMSLVRYWETRRTRDLAHFALFLTWSAGLWEKWVGLAFGLVLFSIAVLFIPKLRDTWPRRHVWLGGVVVPTTLLTVYIPLRFQRISETTQISEAQWVFSYPSIGWMIEEMLLNASHRIGSTFESLFFPQPMLSAAVLGGYSPDQYNQYNKTYSSASEFHYHTIADWYVGWITGAIVVIIVLGIRWVFKFGTTKEIRMLFLGITLLIGGLVQHLPIMYRTYFTLPGYASLLDYKQSISIIGAAILLSVAVSALTSRVAHRNRNLMVALLLAWVVTNNAVKILVNSSLAQVGGQMPPIPWLRVFPWLKVVVG